MSDTCQALVPDVGPPRVCREPREVSYEVKLGPLTAFVDLCSAHAELYELDGRLDIALGWASR